MNFAFDIAVLRALEAIRTPFLDVFFGVVTYLGHEMLYMIAGILAVLLYLDPKAFLRPAAAVKRHSAPILNSPQSSMPSFLS